MSRYELFDKSKLNLKSLVERNSKSDTSIMIDPESEAPKLTEEQYRIVESVANSILASKREGKPVILAYGAHLYKNGCSPILIELIKDGFVQQLLTNGAGVIHDFEMAYFGRTEEDVRVYMKEGQFGLWNETGYYLNKAIIHGAELDNGLGESVGEMMTSGKIENEFVDFSNKQFSVVANAYAHNVPLSVGVGIGQDIIHEHPLCDGAALGKCSYNDFLIFVNSVSKMQNGVFISIGSAVMAPMLLEKALSMAKNSEKTQGRELDNYRIVVNDIQPGTWDWRQGDPPKDNPAYYLRFCKSFARMGDDFTYLCLDNRAFIHNLYKILKEKS